MSFTLHQTLYTVHSEADLIALLKRLSLARTA